MTGRLRRVCAGLALAAMLASARPARGTDYGYFIDIETEDQLLDLLSSGEIDDAAFQTLQDLLNDGVDLNTADREELYSLPNLTYEEVDKIIAFRELSGTIAAPAELVTSGILSERKLLALAAFLIAPGRTSRVDVHGRLRYRAAYVVGDAQAPPMFLRTRITTLKKQLDLGIIFMLTRNELGNVRWDPNRGALSAEGPAVRLRVPKFHIQWQSPHWHVVAGTFRIGFGQRLVLDNTNQYNPNGMRIDDQVYYNRDLTRQCRESQGELSDFVCSTTGVEDYQAPDYRWPIRFRGVGIGLRNLAVKRGWIQAYAFGSFETKNIYQYEIYDRAQCTDPRDDANPACAAPNVYKRLSDPLAPTTRFRTSTLPEMYNELTAGGNLSWFWERRAHLGLTGYGANTYWLVDGANLDFQEWSRTPYGGPFGAMGADIAWGKKWLDLFAEVGRSINNQPDGGDWAGIIRGTATFKKQEIELSGRYYGPNYSNPYARPISAVDEFEGLRATNEAGFRVRHIGQFRDLELRSLFDVWWDVLGATPAIRFRTRAEYEVTNWFRPSLWVDVFDKNVDVNGRGQCFTTPFETFEGEPVDCAGMRTQFGAQLKFLPRRNLSFAARYLHRIQDDRAYPDSYRQDLSAWLTVAYTPREWLNFRLRVRYLNEDIDNRAVLEESIWGYLESIFIVKRAARIKLRYEVYAFIDERASTAQRSPNPSHWIRLEMDYRF